MSRRLTKREVAERYHRHPASIMRDVRAGRFPKPTRLQDGGWPYWTEADLDAFDAHLKAKARMAVKAEAEEVADVATSP